MLRLPALHSYPAWRLRSESDREGCPATLVVQDPHFAMEMSETETRSNRRVRKAVQQVVNIQRLGLSGQGQGQVQRTRSLSLSSHDYGRGASHRLGRLPVETAAAMNRGDCFRDGRREEVMPHASNSEQRRLSDESDDDGDGHGLDEHETGSLLGNNRS
jgi:hypothetical protein